MGKLGEVKLSLGEPDNGIKEKQPQKELSS